MLYRSPDKVALLETPSSMNYEYYAAIYIGRDNAYTVADKSITSILQTTSWEAARQCMLEYLMKYFPEKLDASSLLELLWMEEPC